MGATVQLLDETLVDQIAAGEVIERPANLVKELLENAIDAGASTIAVSLEDGGRGLVRVSDDGIGMSPEDAALCVQRHATSKIATFDDLVTVRTLGFRGEALPSIGAVSRMSITTRRPVDVEGTRIRVEGGVVAEISPYGCPPGTTVEVEDLFYNVPARKKFLRARQTETSKIFEICQRTALIRPELRLVVSSDGRTARQYLPAESLADRAYTVFGDVPLEEIRAERQGVALEAVLAPIASARPGPRHLFLYVNQRPIVDRRLARAVAFAYGDRLPPGHYPRGVVSLSLPAEDVDVNAHPQKTEVRFTRAAHLIDMVTRMLAGRLGASPNGDAYWQERLGSAGPSPSPIRRAQVSAEEGPRVGEISSDYPVVAPDHLRLIAQLRNRYLLCEAHDRVYLLDRARAEEAILYESLRQATENGPLSPQALLFPDRLELDAGARKTLDAHETLLVALGFEWSALGEHAYVIRTIPAQVGTMSAGKVFADAIRALRDGGSDPMSSVLGALAHASATPPGERMDRLRALDIVARLSLDQDAHRQSIITEFALPDDAREGGA
ncbi:MAG: DNA mismatch repair endonuclease MutL [Myxococcales bacterium]|nr:DNA mismatch repair endonuclease MutL [Myxococcales bacterium]